MAAIINTQDFIQKDLSELYFSPTFLRKSQKHGYTCLNDIFAVGKKRLLSSPDFDPVWFAELLDLLARHRILYLLSQRDL